MILLFFISYLFLFFWLKLLLPKKTEFLEIFSTTSLIFLGLSGFIPFILRDYVGIGYRFSGYEILLIAFLLLTIEIFLKRKYKFIRGKAPLKGFNKPKLPTILFTILSAVILLRGFLLPIRGWDAISLYDSRARIFLSGLKLSELKDLSTYDDFNYYYYFSYPPMTSVIHTVFYSLGISRVMVVYALFFCSFLAYLYLLLRKSRIHNFLKVGLFFSVLLNSLLLGQINIAYTNLPLIAFQVGALYYLLRYSEEKSLTHLVISSVLLAFGNWTRSLEPIFVGFIFAAFYLIISEKGKSLARKLFLGIGYLLIPFVTRTIWFNYLHTSVGSIGETTPGLGTILTRILDSLYIANLIEVVFFIFIALFPIMLYIFLIIISLIYRKLGIPRTYSKREAVLIIIISTMVLLMVGGTLYFSTTFSWWNRIPESFLRSNLLLIPISVIFLSLAMEK